MSISDSKTLAKHPKLKREITLAATVSVIYIVTSSFRYYLNKFFPGLPVNTAIKAIYVVLFLLLIAQAFSIVKRRKKSKGKVKLRGFYYLPALILIIAILYKFSPLKFESEWLEGKVLFKACYNGGTSRSSFRLRKNKTFEINWTVDGESEIFYGTYEQRKDTLFLTYENKAPEKFGGIVKNDGHNLVCLDRPVRADEYYVIYTIGLCENYY